MWLRLLSKLKLNSNHTPALLEVVAALVVLLVFVAAKYFDFEWLVKATFCLLYLVIPGWLISRNLGLHKYFSPLGRLSLSIPFSLLINIVVLFMLGKTTPFLVENMEINTIISCLVVSIITFILIPINSALKIPARPLRWIDLVGMLPLGMFIIRVAINPYLVDQDGYSYIHVIESVLKTGFDGSFLYPRRMFFTYIVAPLAGVGGIDLTNLFKIILPGLVWLFIGSIFDLLVNNKRISYCLIILSLLPLAVPSWVGTVDRFKPEIAIYLFSVSASYLYALSLKEGQIRLYIVGLILSLFCYKIHDTGMIFTLVYIMSGIIWCGIKWKVVKPHFNLKNIVLIVLFVFPYIFLFHLQTLPSYLLDGIALFKNDIQLNFRLWFLDSYHSAGAELGWPGWRFLLYYAFNGAILVPILLYIILREGRSKLAPIWPTAIVFVFYFLVAEIFPRLGVILLPDRAIIQCSIMAVFSYLIWLVSTPRPDLIIPKPFQVIFTIIIAAGVGANLYLALNEGGIVSRSESASIGQMNQLESDAIILSTQSYNNVLVILYGKRDFSPITFPDNYCPIDTTDLKDTVMARYQEKVQNVNLHPIQIVEKNVTEKTTIRDSSGLILSKEEKVLLSDTSTRPDPLFIIDNTSPLYFYYSFSKTKGALNLVGRQYWSVGVDPEHSRCLEAIKTSDNTIEKDRSGLLIKVR